jgi:RNA polymerase sigma-70 factor (sigma-E family)
VDVGGPISFHDFVAARRASLFRAAVLLGFPLQDAEDLVQSTLTKALRSWRAVQRADHPDAYVYRILINTAHDQRKRHWRGEIPTAALPERHERASGHTTGIAVRRALAAMSKDHREVLVLRYFLDLSERDTAEALGVAPGTVKSRTARALALLAADESVRSLR